MIDPILVVCIVERKGKEFVFGSGYHQPHQHPPPPPLPTLLYLVLAGSLYSGTRLFAPSSRSSVLYMKPKFFYAVGGGGADEGRDASWCCRNLSYCTQNIIIRRKQKKSLTRICPPAQADYCLSLCSRSPILCAYSVWALPFENYSCSIKPVGIHINPGVARPHSQSLQSQSNRRGKGKGRGGKRVFTTVGTRVKFNGANGPQGGVGEWRV